MKKCVFFLAGALLIAAACEKQPGQEKTGPEGFDYSAYNVRVEPVITKVTETDFEANDAIGLTISRAAGVYATNEKLTFDGNAFTGTLKWYAEGSDAATLTAYYPYAATVPTSFSVETDQTAGTSASDFASASKADVLPSANAVAMVFKHKLSRIVVNVTNNSGFAISGITLQGSIPTATLSEDFTATVDDSKAAADIQLYQASETQFQGILVPQTVAFTAVAFVGNNSMSQRLTEVTLLPGKQYTIDLIVNPMDILVSLSGNITAWENGGAIGEYEVPFEEHLDENYFLYDNQRYSVKQLSNGLWIMTQSMRFVPEGKTISSDPADGNGIWYPYTSDGTNVTPETSAEAIEARGLLYDHEVAFGATITADNFKSFEGTQGICPKGWHIPTRAEFLSIVGASNKADGETAAPTDENAVYYDADYKAARLTTMNADGFNWDFAGSIMRNSNTATGKYQATITKTTNCSVAEWVGKNAITYYMGSTGYTPANTEINRQFMSLMSSFTATYMDGKVSVAYTNYLSGNALRCIRDAQQ